jgi:hypothetical protein
MFGSGLSLPNHAIVTHKKMSALAIIEKKNSTNYCIVEVPNSNSISCSNSYLLECSDDTGSTFSGRDVFCLEVLYSREWTMEMR